MSKLQPTLVASAASLRVAIVMQDWGTTSPHHSLGSSARITNSLAMQCNALGLGLGLVGCGWGLRVGVCLVTVIQCVLRVSSDCMVTPEQGPRSNSLRL